MSMAWDGKRDRRKHKRVNLRLLIEFDDPASKGERQTTQLETLNFSVGGFYCRLSRKLSPLTRLALRFVFPPFGPRYEAERAVNCEAVVVRCDREADVSEHYRVGACFTDLSAEDREFLQEYLEWYNLVYAEESEDDRDVADGQPEEEIA